MWKRVPSTHLFTPAFSRAPLTLAIALACTRSFIADAADSSPPSASTSAATQSDSGVGRSRTTNTWVSYVGLGAQFLDDYAENGDSSGLSKQEFFGDITVDGRFGDECTSGFSFKHFCSVHTGVRLLLLGTPVARASAGGTLPKTFDDVSSAVIFAPHLYWAWWQGRETGATIGDASATTRQNDAALVHNMGPLVRAGVISREKLDTNKDSAAWFYQVGLQYTYEPYRTQKIDAANVINGQPRGYVSASFARFEDYANLGKRSRLVVDSAYQIVSKSKVYLGFKANLGSGPDDFSVVLAYYFEPDKIFDLFSSGEQ